MFDGKDKKDPFDGPYVGNIWGWKFSLFGLILILLLTGIMAYRHFVLGIPWNEQGIENTEVPADSTSTPIH